MEEEVLPYSDEETRKRAMRKIVGIISFTLQIANCCKGTNVFDQNSETLSLQSIPCESELHDRYCIQFAI